MIIMKLRKGLQGPIGKGILIALFVTMFGGLGFSGIIMRFVGDGVEGVAKVNGYDISNNKFQRAIKDADHQLAMIRQQYGQSADILMQLNGISANPQETAFRTIIEDALLDETADKMGLYLGSEYLEARLGDPQFIFSKIGHMLPHYVLDKKYGINAEALMQVLKSPHMRGVEDKLENDLRREFAISMMQSTFYLPQFMLKAAYREAHVAKKFSVQTFNLSTFLQKEKTKGVDDKQLQAFYKKNSDRYVIPEKRSGQSWTFNADAYGIKVTEKEIEKNYNDYKRTRYIETPAQFKVREIVFNKLKDKGVVALKEEAEKVYEELKKDPKQFAELAKKVSQSTTASKGGLVEFFKRGSKDKAYEKASVRLKKDGDISPVTQMADGSFVILQRIARKEATYKQLSQVKETIVKSLKTQKFRTQFSKEADRVIKSADKTLLEKFIEEHKAEKSSVGPLEKSGEGFGRRLFILKKDGQSLAFLQDGKGTILTLKKKEAKKSPSLDKVKEQVKEDYFEKKATQALELAMKEARSKAIATGKIVELDGGKISSTGLIQPTDNEKITNLTTKQGYPHGFMNLDWEGAVISSLNKDGAIVIRLDELEKIDKTIYTAEKQKLYKNAFKRFGQGFGASYIASLYRNATIKVNEQLAQLKEIQL